MAFMNKASEKNPHLTSLMFAVAEECEAEKLANGTTVTTNGPEFNNPHPKDCHEKKIPVRIGAAYTKYCDERKDSHSKCSFMVPEIGVKFVMCRPRSCGLEVT